MLYNFHFVLDSSLLNKHVFAKTIEIRILSQLNSIQADLFKSFDKYLLEIRFTYHIKKLIHKQGIKWISFINTHLDVNISNLTNNSLPYTSGCLQLFIIFYFGFK